MTRLFLFFLFCQIATSALLAQTATNGKVWLVAVGIGTYERSNMTHLDFTVPSAYEFTRIFERRQLGSKFPVLIDAKAKRTQIIETLENTFVFNQEMTEDDLVVFFFSGHGEIAGGKAGICPHDYSTNDVRGLITDEEIQALLNRSPARHKICFVEACKTEAQAQNANEIIDPTILQQFNRQRRQIGGGLVYMTSTEVGQKSWGEPENGGFFSYYLRLGLEGEANANDDAYITVDELFKFVEKGVREKMKGEQVPQINDRSGYDANLPVMIIPSALPPPVPTDGGAGSKEDARPPVSPPAPNPKFVDLHANEMLPVPGGIYQMGSKTYESEQPVHWVKLPDFYLGKAEVTNRQFCAFLNAMTNEIALDNDGVVVSYKSNPIFTLGNQRIHYNMGKWPGGTFRIEAGYEDHPVVYVSWFGAVQYCNWLSGQAKKKYRLPTEAEWEYAARGGQLSKGYTYAGSNDIAEVAWYTSNSGGNTKPVKGKKANELGLHDMSGNVWEWCQDNWHEDYQGAPDDGSAWSTGGNESSRVCRGGSWYDSTVHCRAAGRDGITADDRSYDLGFRVAQDQ